MLLALALLLLLLLLRSLLFLLSVPAFVCHALFVFSLSSLPLLSPRSPHVLLFHSSCLRASRPKGFASVGHRVWAGRQMHPRRQTLSWCVRARCPLSSLSVPWYLELSA